MDPSEGRYAQISREMSDSGDWLVPHWYGVVHLEKPPLAYWTGAAGIRLFGRNEFGLRFFPAVSLLVSALLCAQIARRTGSARAAPAAAAAICLAPYPVAVGAALLTDTYLMLAATLFYHSVFRHLAGKRWSLEMAAVALGVGFLAKGHVIFLFTLLPLVTARPKLLKDLLSPRRLLVFVLIAAPWIVAVQIRYPGFLAEHVHKLVDFVGAGRQHHRAPFFIYVAVLAGGLCPYSLYAPRGARHVAAEHRALLFAWILLPLVVLTVVRSRQATYILPSAPAFALISAHGLPAVDWRRAVWMGSIGAIAVALVFLLLVVVPESGSRLALRAPVFLVGAVAAAACAAWLPIVRQASTLLRVAGVAVIVTFALIVAGSRNEEAFKVHRSLAREVAELAGADIPVVVTGISLPSLGFYLDQSITFAGAGGRLKAEAELWGQSARYASNLSLRQLVAANDARLVVVPERTRVERIPDTLPARRWGKLSLIRAGRWRR